MDEPPAASLFFLPSTHSPTLVARLFLLFSLPPTSQRAGYRPVGTHSFMSTEDPRPPVRVGAPFLLLLLLFLFLFLFVVLLLVRRVFLGVGRGGGGGGGGEGTRDGLIRTIRSTMVGELLQASHPPTRRSFLLLLLFVSSTSSSLLSLLPTLLPPTTTTTTSSSSSSSFPFTIRAPHTKLSDHALDER